MKTALQISIVFIVVGYLSGVAAADWAVGDPYKMHYPQLPDPNGWDVGWCHTRLADDFQCTESGPISDVHLWVSVQQDDPNVLITNIHLSIHANIPCDPNTTYSHPGAILWERDILPYQFTMLQAGQGDQGWDAPWLPYWLQHDHQYFHQINITDISDPFVQEKDTIYWLDVQGSVAENSAAVGWKTSQNHWSDDAVYLEGGNWARLIDPVTGQSLDMAFVITPEPATLSLLGLGGLALLRRKRK